MSYATLLSEEVVNSQFLAVLKPRKQVLYTEFTLHSAGVYKASFTAGPVYGVRIGTTELEHYTVDASLSIEQFFYDDDLQMLYIRKGDSSAPDANDFIVATFEVYVGTFDAHWYRIPTDDTSTQVYFDPRIIKSPVINQASTDLLFGFFPTKSTSIQLANTDHYFESILSDASFNRASIKMWHHLDGLDTANFRLVFSGSMSSVKYLDDRIEISILDQTDVLDQDYRHTSGTSFYATSDFPELDPNFVGKPIRDVFGYVEGFVPVNVDYLLTNPTVTDNRLFSVKKGQSNLGSISRTVQAGSTATVTNVDDATGFQVGDSVWFDRSVGTDEYKLITAVDYGSNTLTHSALSGGAMAASDIVKRSFVGRIDIVQDNVVYTPLYNRDFVESSSLSNGCSGFQLVNNFESALSMPNPFSPNDTIYCRVYGEKTTETLDGNPFGDNDSETGVLCQAIPILYKIMKSKMGLTESEIDTSTFSSLQSSVTDTIGFCVPEDSTSAFPTYKDVVIKILQTLLLRLGKDTDDLWTLREVGPLGAYDKLIEDDEITRGSINYSFDYTDIISNMFVEYGFREIPDKTNASVGQISTVSSSSENSTYLHLRNKQRTMRSLHYKSAQATALVNRLGYALGERRGLLQIESKNRFFDVILGDVIRLSREKVPGFEYTQGTTRTKDFVVIEVTKSLNKVTLLLEDQKGIEDNSGSW